MLWFNEIYRCGGPFLITLGWLGPDPQFICLLNQVYPIMGDPKKWLVVSLMVLRWCFSTELPQVQLGCEGDRAAKSPFFSLRNKHAHIILFCFLKNYLFLRSYAQNMFWLMSYIWHKRNPQVKVNPSCLSWNQRNPKTRVRFRD